MASNSNPSSNNPSPKELRRRNYLLKEFEAANENEDPSVVSQASIKKILGDRNINDTQVSNLSKTLLENNPKKGNMLSNSHKKNLFSEKINPLFDPSPTVAYDPVTNFTSPRPAFLRYNPNRRKEILSRMKDCDENLLSSSSTSSISKDEEKQLEEEEVENKEEDYSSDYEELEVENEKIRCSKNVCKWIFPFVILLVLNCYLFSISTPLQERKTSIENFYSSRYHLRAHMGVSDVCFYIGNEMCDLVISDVVTNSVMSMIDESNKELSLLQKGECKKELSSLQEDESNKELSSLQENIVSGSNGRYNLGIHMGVTHKCFNVGGEMCDLVASDVLSNNNFITLDAQELSVKKSVESMQESTNIDEKLVNDNGSEVAMSTDEFLIHELSSETEEQIEANMIHDSDRAENHESFEFKSESGYEVSNKFGLLAILEAVDMKLILFSGCLLSVMLALWIALSMCFSKSGRIVNDSNVTPSASNHSKNEQKESFILPCSNSVEDNKSKELENKGKDLSLFNKSFSSSPKDENMEFYASRPPAVELLSEFSVVDDLKYSAGKKKIKGYENPVFSKSQGSSGFENSQVLRPRKSAKTAVDSSPSNDGNANEKRPKKEMMMATPSPLRRSSRLQKSTAKTSNSTKSVNLE